MSAQILPLVTHLEHVPRGGSAQETIQVLEARVDYYRNEHARAYAIMDKAFAHIIDLVGFEARPYVSQVMVDMGVISSALDKHAENIDREWYERAFGGGRHDHVAFDRKRGLTPPPYSMEKIRHIRETRKCPHVPPPLPEHIPQKTGKSPGLER